MRPDGKRPVMSECFDAGIVTPAYQVDHVVPVSQRPDLFWDEANHQALCQSCGARKSQAGL
jgi:5-methylcytosine-specific restriction protein A